MELLLRRTRLLLMLPLLLLSITMFQSTTQNNANASTTATTTTTSTSTITNNNMDNQEDNNNAKINKQQKWYTLDSFVEYIPGNSNIILSIPHGGKISVHEIPNRIPGCHDSTTTGPDFVCLFHRNQECLRNETCRIVTRADLKTIELGNIITNYLTNVGKMPHVIICHLKRY